MHYVLLCALLSSVEVFDNKPVYDNPIAYVRSPELGLSVNKTKYKGQDIAYLEGVIGRSVPVLTLPFENLKLQLGLEAGAWLALGNDGWSFPMITQDFYFSVPLYFRYKNLSGAVKFNHISSHKGDGMDILVEDTIPKEEKEQIEQIEEQKNVDISLIERVAYSRDFLSLEVAYEYMIRDIKAKSYIHGGYIHNMHPDELGRLFVGGGTELKYETQYINPYYAHDIRYNQDTDSVDYSGQVGIITLTERLFESRLALTGYIGSDRRGQFVGRKLKQIGIGVFIR